ncbi:type I polyketide synthase [Rhizohabitans arisaemae]|uniref:type I polyketide synthase n=1 Tax=Rhizohabitans arisaemae TaxID=2720610 RepID=UPI0024B118F3|nr:type I polyketide synthase [Rhizohabitans arisaemae]
MSIAIVGLACRYPDSDDAAALWETVIGQRRAFRRIPPERLDLDDYLCADRSVPDTTYSASAAILRDWVFDRTAFGIPGPVYRTADPAHWLALETASRALADAGFPEAAGLDRDRVSVVIGNTLTGEVTRANALRLRWPYVRRVLAAALERADPSPARRREILDEAMANFLAPFPETSDESLAGGLSNTIAGRICNHFDLRGGGYTVDGACASSLLAVITAGTALRDGSADFVLAGGVDLSLDPFELIGFAKAGALADERMRVYDRDSDGFWPGEGCGIVALMRTADAVAQRIPIYAEIAGWGVSSDGRGGMTRPEAEGQLRALRRAYTHAGVHPSAVALFEGHGTGTAVGDTTELRALLTLLDDPPPTRTAPAAIGSVKGNIGHTKAAAGVAGLIKATLSLACGVLPPTTGCREPHPLLRPDGPLRILRRCEPWPDGPRHAGVSGFGFGGVNAHVVLRLQRDLLDAASHRRPPAARTATPVPPPETEVFLFGGDRPADVVDRLTRIAELAPRLSEAELHDLACALAARPIHGPYRVACTARTPAELAERALRARKVLARTPAGRVRAEPGVFAGVHARGRVTLLFPGQGAPVRLPPDDVPPRFPLSRVDLPPQPAEAGPGEAAAPRLAQSRLDTAVAQPAILHASLTGLRVLDLLGVTADAGVGHSLGEITGLVWAGALTEEDAGVLVRERGRIMDELGRPGTGMVSVGAPREHAERWAHEFGLVVAAYNGPASHVLAGSHAGIVGVAAHAERAGAATTMLAVSRGFHSPAMADCADAFADTLTSTAFTGLKRTLLSTVTGGPLGDGDDPVLLLREQITAPVRFEQAVRLIAPATDLFCEVGPGSALAGLVGGVPAVSMDVFGPGDTPLAETMAALFACGAVDGLAPFFAGRGERPIDLRRDPAFLANPCARPFPAPAPEVTAVSEPVADPADAESTVISLVTAATELPRTAITPDHRLLGDLHLTSFRVAQLIASAADTLGRRRPMAPLSMADATIAEVVAVLRALPEIGSGEAEEGHDPTPAGVAPWIRCFTETLGEPGLLPTVAVTDAIRVEDPGRTGELIDACRAALATGRITVLARSDALSGFLRSLWLEHPQTTVTLIRSCTAYPPDEVRVPAEPGYHEFVLDADGRLRTPGLLPVSLRDRAAAPQAHSGAALVTGGGKGIGLECAIALAQAVRCPLALLGRGEPGTDPVLAAGLRRLDAAGVDVVYETADLGDADAVRRAVHRAERRLGTEITMLVHSAGINRPARFADLTAADFDRHVAPKSGALDTLLAAAGHLRSVVTFGSVIGRHGLGGESHYALANGLLREHAVRLAADRPDLRVLHLDWSVWTGAGMAERLGVLDSLLRSGVTPIPVAEGTELFLRLLGTPGLPTGVAVHGRLGEPPAVPRPVPGGRYLETVRVHQPGVELIAESRISLVADPLLDGHRIDGLPVLPAVAGLEAMAQAASALAGRPLTQVRSAAFTQPVVLAEDGVRLLRVCALRDGDAIRTVLRSDETAHGPDHFSAVFPIPADDPCQDGVRPARRDPRGTGDEGRAEPVPAGRLSPEELYGSLCFHTGGFRRVAEVTVLGAYACRAELAPGAETVGGALLGDPAINDATVHALQACVPHRRLLPVGADAFHTTGRDAGGPLTLHARQRSQSGADYVWDVHVTDRSGAPVRRWSGLRLTDAGPLARTTPWPVPLLGVYLQREAIALGLDPSLRVRVAAEVPADRGGSRSRLGGLVLSARARGGVGCDWEPIRDGAEHALGPAFRRLLDELLLRCAEPRERTATRIWTAVECLSKIGRPPTEPITVNGVYENGWIALRCGSASIVSTVAEVAGGPGPVAVALLTGGGG